jgi:hypothetical protein
MKPEAGTERVHFSDRTARILLTVIAREPDAVSRAHCTMTKPHSFEE